MKSHELSCSLQVGARHNMSIDTDPNLQEAASPQTVVVRSFSRCAA
jgi:hypothetical protein